ncbi:hypothetical protein Tco_1241617 [Tanacetum coccineum]
MTSTTVQQVAFDNALVAPDNRVQIGICNMRIDPTKTLKEPTYQFCHTITKIKNSSSYKFKLDKKKCKIDVEVFRDILQICPRLPNQEFDAPPSDEEIVTFIKELGYKGDIKSVTKVVVDQMHQPWRTFTTIINRCLFGKTSGLDKIRLSKAQILWGMYYNKNVDFVELLWEDFMFQIDNRDSKKQEKMHYPIFIKAIIHHFISKDKSISIRNIIFMHIVKHDNILGAGTPKKARKFKKPASSLKKKAFVAVEEPAKKPKKAPTKTDRSKGIELLSEAASLEEAQLKKAIKRSKQETNIPIAGGSVKGAYLESEVPVSTFLSSHEGNTPCGIPLRCDFWGCYKSDDERTEFDDDKSVDLNKTDNEEEDEFVHTPDDYVPTDDENVDDEEYKRINKEMYDDVNVGLKDAEPANEEKGDEEMTHAENVNAKHEEVSQEVASDQVKDDA